MDTVSEQIESHLSAIVERQEGVATALTGLDQLLNEHRSELPARLTHFLENRSYQKALSYIRVGDTGHHP